MNDSIRLGNIRGIRIGVHWSVLVIGWLLAWGLASQILPAAAPGAADAAYWAAGIAVAVVFFASLLAHELAHAFFARRAGVRVEGITLWILGGVAKLEGEAPTPLHDLRIAASGPLTSLSLAALFTLAAAGLGAAGAPALLVVSAAWLGGVNALLGLFNLLPGAPLDGGRIVRAIAWQLGHDRLRASLIAARIGRIIGFGLVIFGGLELVAGADLGGIWTMVIGMFMVGAASAEQAHAVTRAALGEARMRDLVSGEPVRAPAGITVDLFADGILAAEGRDAALVVDAGGSVIGVAGLAEVARLSRGARREQRVRDITVPLARVPEVASDAPALATLEAASRTPGFAGYLLVTEDGRPVGLVSGASVATAIRTRLDRSAGAGVGREQSAASKG